MNTPKPCDGCDFCRYDPCAYDDATAANAFCWLLDFPDGGKRASWGNDKCPRFRKWVRPTEKKDGDG